MASPRSATLVALAALVVAILYHKSIYTTDDIPTSLAPRLSSGASLYLPGSEGYNNGSHRYQEWKKPQFDAIVRVSSSHDIEETIRYANEKHKPFLAISGAHGATKALGEVKGAIGIWIRGLNSVTIDSPRNVATVGGGITSGELVRALTAAGKETVTGACACTGAIAPALGGGHGWLQGEYGQIGDQLLSAQLTIANGTTITVSDEENEDLFWAMKGAGHNFGIVSEFQMRIYDNREHQIWSWKRYVFGKSSISDVYERLNLLMEDAPIALKHMALITRVPAIDSKDSVLTLLVTWRGPQIPIKYAELLSNALPMLEEGGTTDLNGLFRISGMDEDGIACVSGYAFQRSPIGWTRYNPSLMQEVYDLMNRLPPEFNRSIAMTADFSSAGKKAVPVDSTAVPDRESNILLSPYLYYPPGSEQLHGIASSYGRAAREIYLRGIQPDQQVNSYVNYATGSESQEDVYGHEGWRLERLRCLKKEFDPHERFSFYVPIELK